MKKIFLFIIITLIIIQPISAFSLSEFLKNFNINQITGLPVQQDPDPSPPPPEPEPETCEEAGGVCRIVCHPNEYMDNTKTCGEEVPISSGGTGAVTENYCCMPISCTENWECSSWSSCINNQQNRTCTDLNNCGTFENKPPELQSCTPEQNACEQIGGTCKSTCSETEEINNELTLSCQTSKCCTKSTHCYDGTLYGTCSTNFKYCNNNNLIENCDVCGCPTNKECINNECTDIYIQGTESNNQNLINLPPTAIPIPSMFFSINSNLNNIVTLNQYFIDPEGQTLTFSFKNNINFNSNIISCTITNSILNCNAKNAGTINLIITASDKIDTTPTTITITIFDPTSFGARGIVGAIENTPPVADAGTDKTVYINQQLILDASRSYDAENNIILYAWFEKENKIGEGITFKTKFTSPGTHKITLKVTDTGNEISTDIINIKVANKKNCLETNTIYFPEDTTCNKAWPSNQGELIKINSPINSCDLFEVCNEKLDPIIEDAIDCCDSTGLKDQKKTNACNFAITNSKDSKKCQALYIIKALGPNAIYMQDYFTAEMCCYGVKELCPNPLHWYTTKPLPKTDKDLNNIRCSNSPKNNPHGTWLSNTNIALNNIALSDIPTEASINILGTGTCVDYSSALTTLLRKIGYKKDDVFTVEASTHAYNLVRFPLDKKYTIIDTTGNNDGIKLGKVPLGYKYCENIKNCYNDMGEHICPDNEKIFGCENIKTNVFRESKVIGTKLTSSLKKFWHVIVEEINR